MGVWGEDGWAVAPGAGERVDLGGPHWLEVLVRGAEYDFRVGDATFSGGPGTIVVVPKGSQHTFTTPTGGRMLFVSSPAGNEEMFLERGRLGPEATPERLEELNARFQTHGLPGDEGLPWRQLRPAD